jgi:hypothetical protein
MLPVGFYPENDDVEGIASRLGSPVKPITFPLDTTKCAQMTVRTPNHVIEQNRVELSRSPFVLNLVGYQQFFRKIGTNPLSQLRRVYNVVYDIVC